MQVELKTVDILFVDKPIIYKFAEMNRMGSRKEVTNFKKSLMLPTRDKGKFGSLFISENNLLITGLARLSHLDICDSPYCSW